VVEVYHVRENARMPEKQARPNCVRSKLAKKILFYSLKSLSLDSHFPMFSLISLKVSLLRLALSLKVSVLRLADNSSYV
jgi:hypothetical protein